MDNTIKIPRFLHELHGEKSNWFDIISIHVIALLAVMTIQFWASDLELPSWKNWILIALTYDLSGGVVANFTSSTNKYYQSTKRRIIFLSLHFLQPLFMCWIFPEEVISIGIFTGYAVFIAFVINAIQKPKTQLTIGVFLSLIGIIALFFIPLNLSQVLLILLIMFFLKLPFSFAIRWDSLKKNKNSAS